MLGSGGMGIVYRAWDPQLARAVAIKVVRRASDDEKGRARLVREAQALARLSHPNVVAISTTWDVTKGISRLRWSWSTARRCATGGRIAPPLVGGEARRAPPARARPRRRARRGDRASRFQARERDRRHDGRARVTDFGLARGEDIIDSERVDAVDAIPHLTATGAIAGTPAYIAPEQLTGDPIDARVDQFAFAVMAWELP